MSASSASLNRGVQRRALKNCTEVGLEAEKEIGGASKPDEQSGRRPFTDNIVSRDVQKAPLRTSLRRGRGCFV
jgi:hypothetical protein